MDSLHYALLARLRDAELPIPVTGDDAPRALELWRLGLVEAERVRAFGDSPADETVFVHAVTGAGHRALDAYAHRRRNLALRFLGWIARVVVGRILPLVAFWFCAGACLRLAL